MRAGCERPGAATREGSPRIGGRLTPPRLEAGDCEQVLLLEPQAAVRGRVRVLEELQELGAQAGPLLAERRPDPDERAGALRHQLDPGLRRLLLEGDRVALELER